MKTIEQLRQERETFLHSIVTFIWVNKGKSMSWADTYEKLFRYTAFCLMHGKLSVLWNDGKVTGCVFYWSDWKEHIESKEAEGRQQFEWAPTAKGDALFVGAVIGNRQSIGKLYHEAIVKWPHLLRMPLYTMRNGQLVQLSHKILNRFAS